MLGCHGELGRAGKVASIRAGRNCVLSAGSAIFWFVSASHGDLEPALSPIGDEARRLEESAMYSAQGQFERAKFWRGLNLSLGVGAAVLAATGGAVTRLPQCRR